MITIDSSMWELFLSEVDTHTSLLNNNMLRLEVQPNNPDILKELMRSAHSLKGGAGLMNIKPAIIVAHSLEDYFVAVQKQKLTCHSDHLDILFNGVDLLEKICKNTQFADDKESFDQSIIEANTFNKTVQTILSGVSESESEPVHDRNILPIKNTKTNSPKHSLQTNKTNVDSTIIENTNQNTIEQDIRVTVTKINRLMSLTGEISIHVEWLLPFLDSLTNLKRKMNETNRMIEQLREMSLLDSSKEFTENLNCLKFNHQDSIKLINNRLNEFDLFTSSLITQSERLSHEIIDIRMRPFEDAISGLQRVVRDVSRKLNKKVQLIISGKSTEVDRDILVMLETAINHIVRNALDHGIEQPFERLSKNKPEVGTIEIEAIHQSGMLFVSIADDGKGINFDNIRKKVVDQNHVKADIAKKLSHDELTSFLFLPGFSTSSIVSEISGRGVGLDIVQSMANEIGGKVWIETEPDKGTKFNLELPLSLSVIRTLLVQVAGEPYAFPLTRIFRCQKITKEDLYTVENKCHYTYNNNPVLLIELAEILDIPIPIRENDLLCVVMIQKENTYYGLIVDQFSGECDLVIKPLDDRLGDVPNISAMAILIDGAPVLICDVEEIIQSIESFIDRGNWQASSSLIDQDQTGRRKRILVIDDSITVRETERKLLEKEGFDIDIAVNGRDGIQTIRSQHYDMVITDIDMPIMDGIEVVKYIRKDPQLSNLPVMIVSYKFQDEDRLRGLEAGADYYLTKSSFQDRTFVEAVLDLVGDPIDRP